MLPVAVHDPLVGSNSSAEFRGPSGIGPEPPVASTWPLASSVAVARVASTISPVAVHVGTAWAGVEDGLTDCAAVASTVADGRAEPSAVAEGSIEASTTIGSLMTPEPTRATPAMAISSRATTAISTHRFVPVRRGSAAMALSSISCHRSGARARRSSSVRNRVRRSVIGHPPAGRAGASCLD